jgi:hypothetical protein
MHRFSSAELLDALSHHELVGSLRNDYQGHTVAEGLAYAVHTTMRHQQRRTL